MDIKEIKKNARERMKFCRVCKVCDGVACAGEVPGMGGTGTGAAFKANLEALSKVKLNMRTLHDAKDPNISVELFGCELSMPILAAPITGTEYNMGPAMNEAEFIEAVISGSNAAGTLGMCGDGANPVFFDSGLEAMKKVNGRGIPVMKPRENKVVFDMAKKAQSINVPAIGMDVDGAGLVTMAMYGQPVGPKNPAELKDIISKVHVPFILKGIMTPDEAEIALEAGAAAIVVSNHGGRILDSTPGAAEVLPAIAQKVKGKMTILADGGVRHGIDVLKYLALGADAVLVGRPIIIGAYGGGAQGVHTVLETMAKELKAAMILTGCKDIKDITDCIITY